MKSKLKWGSVMGLAVVCTAMLTGLTGCKFLGQGRQEVKAPAEEAGQSAANANEPLKLRLILATQADPDLPDKAVDLKAKSEKWSDEKVVALEAGGLDFPVAIVLPNQKHPARRFLVWSEDWRGEKIRTVIVDQRIEELDGRLIGATERIDVHYDKESRRWFFPLTDLVKSRPGDADGSRPHQLTLDLILESGRRILVPVRLRFRPVNSALEFGAVQEFMLLNLETRGFHAHKIGTDGLLLRASQITNPFDRPIKGWIKGDLEVGLTTFLGPLRIIIDPIPRQAPPLPHASRTRLRLVPSLVIHASGARESMSARNNDWTSINLAPHETVTVHWTAYPVSNDSCLLPPPTPRSLGRYGTTMEPWAMIGHTLRGTGSISINYTQPDQGVEALESIGAPMPRTLPLEIDEHYGDGNDQSPAFTCQGWIKLK